MTERTRVRLGAYFLFALLLLTLPVTLLVTHYETVRHAQQWQATPTGVQLANANYRPQAVQWAKQQHGLSTEGAERYVRDQERRTKTSLDLGQSVPYGAQLDYYKVDGTQAKQTARLESSATVAAANSPAAQEYMKYVRELPAEKKTPDFLREITSTLKKGYVLIPTALGQTTSATKGRSTPVLAGAKAGTTNYRIAVICTKLPGFRDVSPRSDGDTDPNDTGNLAVDHLTRAASATPTEVSYRQVPYVALVDEPTEATVGKVYNYATTEDTPAGTDISYTITPFGSNLASIGSVFDSPGGVFNASGNWGIPYGVPATWDYTQDAMAPAASRTTNLQLQNYMYDLFFNTTFSAPSVSNWFYQQSHGQIKFDGTANDIIGWLYSAHQTNRYPYQIGGGNAEFIFPGTPVIRPLPASGADPTADQVVRASLSSRGLTVLFSHPRSITAVGQIVSNLNVFTNSDTDGNTAGTQTGNVNINWTQSTYSLVMDPYDGRRWTITNPGGTGWKYALVSGTTTTWTSWVAYTGGAWTPTWSGTFAHLGTLRTQNQGCADLDNTLVTTADMRVSKWNHSTLNSAAERYNTTNTNTSVTFGNVPFCRLKSMWYYTHSYDGAVTRQIKHLNNEWGYGDDIAGTAVRSGDEGYNPRVYPFDCGPSDAWNGGYWPTGSAREGSAGAYSGDVNKVLQDNGISLTGYGRTIYIAADGSGGSYAGPFQPSSSLNNFNESGSGVAYHELAHTFGAGDLYDNDLYANASVPAPNPRYHQCAAMGPYSIMDAGGRLDAWHLIRMGFAVPQVITQDTLGVQIPEVEGQLRDPVILKLPANPYYLKKSIPEANWQEYFLVENRNVNSSDGNGGWGLDSSTKGLYIYHIDMRGAARNNLNQSGFQREDDLLSVIIEQADGRYELEFNDKGNAGTVQTDPFGVGGTLCGVTRFWQFPMFNGDTNDQGSVVSSVASAGSPTSFCHGMTSTERSGTAEPGVEPPVETDPPVIAGGKCVIEPGTETDSFVRLINISGVGQTMTADVFVEPAEVRVTGTALTLPTTIRQGDTNVGMLKLTLENRGDGTAGKTDMSRVSSKDVYLDTLRILESGTSTDGNNLSAVKLFVDANANGNFDPPGSASPDTLLATTTVQTTGRWQDYASFTGLGYRVALDTTGTANQVLFIAYDIAAEAQTNPYITVGAEIADAAKILPRVPGTVESRRRIDNNPTTENATSALYGTDPFNFGSYMFPIVSSTGRIHNYPDRLVVSQPTPYTATNATPGETNVPLLRMRLEANKDGDERTAGFVRIADMKVEAESTTSFSAPSELVNATLWDDLNRNGVIDVSTDTQIGQSSFSINGSRQLASFVNLNLQVLAGAANAKDLIVSANVSPGATVGKTFNLSVKFSDPGDWASSKQTNCDLQLMNPNDEDNANKDYIEFAGTDFVFPIASPLVTIISPNTPPNRVVSGFSPTGGAIIFNQSPTLQWDAATDPDTADTADTLSYKVDLATDGTFSNIIRTIDTLQPNGTTQWTVPAPVLGAGTYYWRVRTRDSHGSYSTQYSDTQQFVVQLNAPPNRITSGFDPQNISVTTLTPQITWGKTTDPNPGDPQNTLNYKLQIDDNADFSSPNVDWTGTPDDNTFDVADWSGGAVLSPLQWGVQYYWRVQALDDQTAASAWTNEAPGAITLWFRPVNDRAPNAPVGAFVYSDGAEVMSANPVLQWSMPATPDPDPTDTLNTITYELQLGTSADLSSGPYTFTANVSASAALPITKAVTTNLSNNTHYYWRVRAIDDEGSVSTWTTAQDFWVNTQNDAPSAPVQGFSPVNGATISTTTPTLSWDNTWVAQDPSLDVDPDPYDGAYDGAGAPAVVGVTWVLELSQSNSFATIPYTYTVPRRTAVGDPQFTLPVALTNATTWYWRVRAVDNDGAQSPNSAVQHFVVNTNTHAPTAPTSGFSPANATNVSSLTPLLQWGAGTDTDVADTVDQLRYEVQVAEDAGFATGPGYFWAGGPTANGQQMITVGSALTVGTTYYWRVRTVDTSDQRSPWSTTLRFTVVLNNNPNTITGGFYPTGGLNVSDTTPDLTWNAATPPDPDADDTADTMTYQVEVDDNNTFNSPEYSGTAPLPYANPNTPVATVTSPLAVGITYYWRVRALDNDLPTPGVSAWSATQSFKIVDNQAPYAPVAPFTPSAANEVSDATPRLSWTAATPPDPNVSDTAATMRYEVQLKADSDLGSGPYLFSDTVTGSTFTDVTVALQDNTHYYYRVRAIDSGNLNSPWSAVQDFWVNTVNNPPTEPVTGFDPASGATVPSTTPTVSWDNSVDQDPDPYDANVTTGAVIGVTFTVEFSRNASFVPVAYTYNTGQGVSSLTPTVALTDATTWYWHVRAVDNDGSASAWSTTQSLAIDTSKHAPGAPVAPFNPAGGATVSGLTPTLSWGAATDIDTDQGPETLRYEVEVAEDAGFATSPGYYWKSTATAAGITTIAIPSGQPLTVGTTYYWRVRALDGTSLYSAWSARQQFVVGANRAPNAVSGGFTPTGGNAISDSTPDLTWNAATDPDADDTPDVMTYEVTVDNNAGFGTPEFQGTTTLPLADATRPTINVNVPLTVGVTYNWRVRARDNEAPTAGVSAWSATQTFRVVANMAPSTPIAQFIPSGGTIVTDATPTLSWNNPNPPNPVDPNTSDTIDTIAYELQINETPDFSGTPLLTATSPVGQASYDVPLGNALTDDTRYYWRVRAVDGGGLVSPWSATQDFWVNSGNDDPTAPVDGFSPSDGAGISTPTPRLAWNAGTDSDPADLPNTLRYQIQLSSNNFATVAYDYATVNGGVLFYDVTNALTDQTVWYWRVRTLDANGGMSPWSVVLTFRVDTANNVPNPPATNLNPAGGRNVSDTTPTISFDPGSDPDPTDTPETLLYEIELADTNAFTSPAPVGGYYWFGATAQGVTTITLPDANALTTGKTYYWHVRTVDDAGTRSAWSVTQTFIIGANQNPNAVTGGFNPTSGIDISDATPTLSWDPATDPDANDTANVLRYQVVLDDNNDFSSILFDRTTVAGRTQIVCNVTLQVGVTYYWRVITIDEAGAQSAASATQSFRVIKNSAPYAPISAFSPSGGSEVTTANPTLTWHMPIQPDPDPNDDVTQIKYLVQLKDAEDLASAPYTFTVTTARGTMQASVTTDLQDNTQYWWRVRAIDHGGLRSDWSVVQTFWVNLVNQDPLAPDAGFDPTNGRQISDDTPLLTWSAASDPDPFDDADTLHYIVELSTDSNFATTSYQYTTNDGVTQATATVALTDLTRWYWRVRTVDADGAQSPWSAIQNFRLDMGNQAPTLSNPQVTPMYGALGDYYTLQVTYTDAENDPSGKVYCQFDNGQPPLEMTQLVPGDTNARDGIVFQVGIQGTTLGLGAHSHYFYCDAGARLPNTGYDVGPVIGVASQIWFTNANNATATTYEEGKLVWVRVHDADQNVDPAQAETLPVTITESGGDSETITLTETGPNTSYFRGSLPTLGKAGAPNDGTLNAIGGTSGNLLTASYQDPDDGGNPTPDRSSVTAMLYDTVAPAAVGAGLNAVSGPDGRTALLDWTAYNETTQVDVAGYHVYYATSYFTTTAGLTPVTTLSAGEQTFEMTGLTPNRPYYFAVAAFDEVPNENTAVTPQKVATRDTTAPTISGQTPAPGATEVARNTGIEFYLDDPGVGVDRKSLVLTVTQNSQPVACGAPVFEGSNDHLKVSLQPTEDLPWNALVKIDIDVKDKDGNQLLVTDWTFETVTDYETPALDTQVPAPKATNVPVSTSISFHLKDGKSGIDPASIQVLLGTGGNNVDVTADLSTSGTSSDLAVLYDPAADLNYSTTYRVTVTARDVAGNTVGPISWTFSTVRDASGVTVDQFDPERDAVDVPIDTNVSLRLSDAQAGIDRSTLRMWVHNVEVTDTVTVQQIPDPSDHPTTLLLSYNPPQDLPYATDIQVRVYVKDIVGNTTDLSYKFRTTDAPTYLVSGVITDSNNAPLAGVTVSAGGQTATSDGTGGYRISGLLAGTYTVTPTRAQYDFAPVSTNVTLGPDDAVGTDFVGTLRTYTLSGRVTSGGSGLGGVAVVIDSEHTATTAANGTYTLTGLPNGQYTVTPQLTNYHFQPTSRAAQVDGAPVTGVDFQGIADTFTISGTLKDNLGNRLQGVQVKAADKAGKQADVSTVTNAAGQYIVTGLRAGDFTLSAVKSGYTISPASREVTVPPSAVDIDFTAMTEISNTFPAGWNLIGLPGTPADTDATHVFGTVECYRYDPEATPPAYRAAVNDPTLDVVKVKPGRGFFVRFGSSTKVSTGGVPTDTTRSTSIGLNEGWNMIANPQAVPVNWSRFVPSVTDGIRPFAYVFDNTTRSYKMVSSLASLNAERDTLLGWEGAWVRAVSGGVSLIVGAGSGTADSIVKLAQADLNGGWIIPVQATAGRIGDFCSVAGVVPGSGDQHTVENPPTAPNTVDVYFTNTAGARLAQDIRSQSGAQTYDFVVACGVPNVDVTVSLPDLSKVPADLQILLVDADAGKTMYARTMSAYTYHSSSAGAERKFQLVVEPRNVGTLVVTTTAASAKGEGVVFTYNVSKACQVTMRVLNLAGRTIKTLATNKPVTAGVQSQAWNLASEGGTKVPAGSYLLQIEAVAENGQCVRGLSQVSVGR